MQFKIRITDATPEIGVIENAIRAIDPAAVVDIDQTGETLRVAASLDPAQLLRLIGQTGYAVAPDQLQQVPSDCCGGCGG